MLTLVVLRLRSLLLRLPVLFLVLELACLKILPLLQALPGAHRHLGAQAAARVC